MRAADVPEEEQGSWNELSKLLTAEVENTIKQANNCNMRDILDSSLPRFQELSTMMSKRAAGSPNVANIRMNLENLKDDLLTALLKSVNQDCGCNFPEVGSQEKWAVIKPEGS